MPPRRNWLHARKEQDQQGRRRQCGLEMSLGRAAMQGLKQPILVLLRSELKVGSKGRQIRWSCNRMQHIARVLSCKAWSGQHLDGRAMASHQEATFTAWLTRSEPRSRCIDEEDRAGQEREYEVPHNLTGAVPPEAEPVRRQYWRRDESPVMRQTIGLEIR